MRHLALTIYGTGYCANRRDKRKLDDVRIMKAVREILEAIGEDPEREGLKDTPDRIA